MKSGRSNLTLRRLFILGSLPALLVASRFYYPLAFDGPPLCFFKLNFGLPCMGCGLTRAFCCLLHGEIARAAHFHFLAPLVLGYIAAWWTLQIARFRTPDLAPKWFDHLGRGTLLLLAFLYMGRMVIFFSAPEGFRSVLLQNIVMRLIRMDWTNTYEP